MNTLSDEEFDAIATGVAHSTPGTEDPDKWKIAYIAARAGAVMAQQWISGTKEIKHAGT